MKKIYDSKIIQYSLKGDIIAVFDNVKKASNIVNYDSIINCCKGKYKTAGGYVWRFEKDYFSLSSDREKNTTINCNICQSNESLRSFAMHLKWCHNIKTNEYIQKYGEFRPKHIQKLKYEIKCEECNTKLNSNQHLMYHITKHHPNLTKHDYIIKYLLNNIQPTCKCGCGQLVTILENGKNCDLNKETYFRDYIKGHWDWEVFSTIKKQSKEELDLLDFLKSIYDKNIKTNIRNIIPKAEIDIYLPDLKIGIEYNGLYWHSEKGGRFKDYHLSKLKKAQKNNIRLIQIFSDEWINKKDIVKNKLKSIICDKKERIYARKCEVKEISSKDKNTFLNKHHIQGEDRSQIKLGLYYNNTLISVITFNKPRIALGVKQKNQNINSYELSRFASSQYVVGGLSKLIKYFITKHNPKEIYSYSDNRWTDPNNNMYLKAGFVISKTSPPNYFYTKNFTERIHRFNFNKFHLKKIGADVENKTERKIMEELGYTRIWDCGSTKYTLQ